MLAMNDNAFYLKHRDACFAAALRQIASKLAPTALTLRASLLAMRDHFLPISESATRQTSRLVS